jgi:6-phosphogluconate dehydrogenase
MKIGFVGLGRMGANMVERLLYKGHQVIGFDINEGARKSSAEKGMEIADSLPDLARKLSSPKIIWIMLPAGKPTEETITILSGLLAEGDILIDGGNSYYKDSMRMAAILNEKGIFFLDAGTSGGIWVLEKGCCLMIGGEKNIFERVEPLFKSLSPEEGYAHVGKTGAGHFVKMIHNGIEYALLQSYAEGFEIMEAKKEFDLDLKMISRLWNHGSVVRSWLLELAERVFEKDAHLESILGYVEDSGEGRWTAIEAMEKNVPAPVITLSLLHRIRSRQADSFSAKLIAALRNEFGGHRVKSKSPSE